MLSSLYLNYICKNKILIDLNPKNDVIPTSFDNVTYFYIEINRHILYKKKCVKHADTFRLRK